MGAAWGAQECPPEICYLSSAGRVQHTRSQTSLSPLIYLPTHCSVGLLSRLNVEDLEWEKIFMTLKYFFLAKMIPFGVLGWFFFSFHCMDSYTWSLKIYLL